MDIDRELRDAEKTGEVILGSEETTKAIKAGHVKLVVIAMNYPDYLKSDILKMAELNSVPLHSYEGNARDLGLAFGKPFLVSVASVIDPGDSKIEELGVASENQA